MQRDDEKSTLFLALRALAVTLIVLLILIGLRHMGITACNTNVAAEQVVALYHNL